MAATKLINLINTFELYSVGHSTLEGAMSASFGLDWEATPEFCQVANYVSNCMSYDSVTGEWY